MIISGHIPPWLEWLASAGNVSLTFSDEGDITSIIYVLWYNDPIMYMLALMMLPYFYVDSRCLWCRKLDEETKRRNIWCHYMVYRYTWKKSGKIRLEIGMLTIAFNLTLRHFIKTQTWTTFCVPLKRLF